MSTKLPDFIEPFRYAEQARRLSGQLSLADMSRLVDQTGDQEGSVSIELSFDIDRQKRYFLTGKISGHLTLTCERCLELMRWPLQIETRLLMVTSEKEGEQIGPGEDFLLVTEDRLLFKDIIEDEILLALPIIASHEEGVCKTDQKYTLDESNDEESTSVTENPFSVLADFKK